MSYQNALFGTCLSHPNFLETEIVTLDSCQTRQYFVLYHKNQVRFPVRGSALFRDGQMTKTSNYSKYAFWVQEG